MCLTIHPLSQMLGTSTFSKYDPAYASRGKALTPEVIRDAQTALDELARIWHGSVK
jgi:hypothetical protein